MFSKLTHVAAVALSLSIAAPAFAAPKEDECDKLYSLDHFLDCEKAKLIAQKEAKTDDNYKMPLIHEEATKAYAWYAQWFVEKYGELELQKIDDVYVGTETMDAEEIVDEDATDDWEGVRRLILAIIKYAIDNANSLDTGDIAFNSVYDGTVYSPSNQTSASAVLQLARTPKAPNTNGPNTNDVTATLWVDNGLVADTSWGFAGVGCPDVAIPAGVFPFRAHMNTTVAPDDLGNLLNAKGSITRNIKVLGIGTGSIGANFSLALQSGYDNLAAAVSINTPTGCSDTTMTATFTRRPGSGPQP